MSKLSIKMGTFQVDYEGTDDFIKRDLLGLLTSVSTLVGKTDSDEETEDEEPAAPHKPGRKRTGLQLTTGSIASTLDCKSGPDLVIAACAYLTFVKGEPACKRSDIIAQMKATKTYIRKNYVSNLTSYLVSLVKAKKLNEAPGDEYVLAAKFAKELKGKLDNN